MPKDVKIKCAHCFESTEQVPDNQGVEGVPDTYVQTAISKHKSGFMHGVNYGSNQIGLKPKAESISGNLSDFTHGKDHNA